MKATIAFAKKRCYMNAQTRLRFGITAGQSYQVDGHLVTIKKAPLSVANLCELVGRKDLLFMDRASREAAGFAIGQTVDISSTGGIKAGSLADKLAGLKVGDSLTVTRSQGSSQVYGVAKRLGMKVSVRTCNVDSDKAVVYIEKVGQVWK